MVTKRPDNFRLNSSHSLAAGLVFAGLGGFPGSLRYDDASGCGRHGTLTNGPTWRWASELGRWAVINGTAGGYVALGSLPLSNMHCVAVWVYRTGADTTWPRIIGCDNGGLSWDSTTAVSSSSRMSIVASTSGVVMNRWHHLAVRSTGATAQMFFDGVEVNTGTGIAITSLYPWNLFNNSSYNRTMYGMIADPLIINRAIADSEIKQLADPSNVMLSDLILPSKRNVYVRGFASSLLLDGESSLTSKILFLASGKLNLEGSSSLSNVFTLDSNGGLGETPSSTVENTSIVRDCWWLNPGSSQLKDETGQGSSYVHGLYKSLNSNDSQYISSSGTTYYCCRLENSNVFPEWVNISIDSSGTTGDYTFTPYVNNMPLGSSMDLISSGSKVTSQKSYDLSSTVIKRIVDGRILNNYDFFELGIEPVNTSNRIHIYNIGVQYSGSNDWTNHETGLPITDIVKYYPKSIEFTSSSNWITNDGSNSGVEHISSPTELSSSDSSYIYQVVTPEPASYWTQDGVTRLTPNGGLSLLFNTNFSVIPSSLAFDSVGGYNGSWSGVPVFSTDVPSAITNGQSLVLDGNVYASCGDVLDVGTNDLSIVAWIKTTTNDTLLRGIVAKSVGGITEAGRYVIRMQNGKFGTFFNGIATPILGNIAIDDGQWHCLTATFDRDALAILYVDGIQDVTIAMPASSNQVNNKQLLLGTFTGSASVGPFVGKIAKILMFHDVIPSADVLALSNNEEITQTPVASWSFDYDDTLDSLSQVTRAQLRLRMSLPPSGLAENARDVFEINGYNYRYKEGDNKEDIPDLVTSIGSRDDRYGYFVYGAGDIVEQSGFKTYTTELNFLDPNISDYNLGSIKHRNIDIFNNMEMQLVGLPSGTQLSAAELLLEYIPNDICPLYTVGGIYRNPQSVYPDTSGALNVTLGNGKWHHQGNLNYGEIFDGFYDFSETSGTRTYPKYGDSAIYGEYRNSQEVYVAPQEPVRHNYYRNPISAGSYTSPTYYRNAVANSGAAFSENVNIMFDDRLVLGTDFTLYFMLYRYPQKTTLGHFVNRGIPGGTNWEFYEFIGYLSDTALQVWFHDVTRSVYPLTHIISSDITEPILVWLTCKYEDGFTTCKLYTHSNVNSYFSSNWQYSELTFPGYRYQATATRMALGSLDSPKFQGAAWLEFGYANEAIDFSYLTSLTEIKSDYTISSDPSTKFFASRLCNAQSLQGSGINWAVPEGSGSAEFSTKYFIDDWVDISDGHSLYNPVTTAGTNHIVHPSAIYVDLTTTHNTNHPSGAYVYIDIGFDSGSTNNWKVCRSVFNIPSGETILQTRGIDYHVRMNEGPARYSDVDNITATITTKYVDIEDQTYYGDLTIDSLKVNFDSYSYYPSTNNDLDLYVYGKEYSMSGILNLYSAGDLSTNNDFDLYTVGIGHPSTGTMPLYTISENYVIPPPFNPEDPDAQNVSTLHLFIDGLTPIASSGSFPTYIWATESGVGGMRKSAPLYISGLGKDSILPLYISVPNGYENTSLNLYLENDNTVDTFRNNTNLDLFVLGPSGINENMDLYIQGLGTTEGAFPINADMPLFMARDSEAICNTMPLTLNSKEKDLDTELYTQGHLFVSTSEEYEFASRVFSMSAASFDLPSSSVSVGANDFSIEFWYYPFTFYNFAPIFSNRNSLSEIGWDVFINKTGVVRITFFDGVLDSVNLFSELQVSKWNHVILSVNRSTNAISFYKNGVFVDQKIDSSLSTTSFSNSVALIGGQGSGGSVYKTNGKIARLRLGLGYLYTQNDITESYNNGYGKLFENLNSTLRSNITHAWNMTEEGDTIYDSVGSNDGVKAGAGIIGHSIENRYSSLYISGSGAYPTSDMKLYTHGF